MIPFYSSYRLRPCFPPPQLQPRNTTFNKGDENRIRQFLADAPYFMTLSLHPALFASCLWSVFWQPEIVCNLVSPRLTSIHRTLRPTSEANDLETLLKVFLARRPRCGAWWFAMFMLGDCSILDWILSYLKKVEERWGYGTLSPPDPLAELWTGTKQSFVHSGTTRVYNDNSCVVLREDWLRCRFNFKFQDPGCVPLAWLSFGSVDKRDIEPELWPF